jgi:integrase
MAKAFTPVSIEAMKADPDKRREVPDPALSGLYLIVQPGGAKSWAARYRFANKPRKLTLGRWPIMGLADARKAASEAFAKVEAGTDPGNEKTRAKVDRNEAVKVVKAVQGGVVVEKAREMLADFERRGIAAYVAEAAPEAMGQLREAAGAPNKVKTLIGDYAKRHLSTLRSGAEVKRRLEVEVLPLWGDRDAREITRRDVRDLLDKVADSGRLTSANRLRLYLSGFFAWLVDREVIEASPVVGVKAPAKEQKRDRVLTEDEIRWLWLACDAVGEPWGPLGKVLLLTGQRRGEVLGMTDAEITGEDWHLSAKRTKNGRPHVVRLSDPAKAVLKAVTLVKGAPGYIFTTTGETPLSGLNKGHAKLAEAMATVAAKERGQPVQIPHWTWHDLRRTAATRMAGLKIPAEVVEAALNHVSGVVAGVAGVYNRHDYADEKRDALDAWARYVLALVEGAPGNVVRLEARG